MSNAERMKLLIDKLPEIEALFSIKYVSFVKPAFKPPVQTPMRTIHNHPDYMSWRAEIECELDQLPESRMVDEIHRLFKKIDGGWTEDTDFSQLKAKLTALRNHLPDVVGEEKKRPDETYEERLCRDFLKALIAVQKNQIYKGKQEDEINDGLRDMLNMAYDVKDQTRQGVSESEKQAGEVDLLITEDGLPTALIEALKLPSMNKDYVHEHIKKALINYDPVGCKYVFLFSYYNGANFESFWEKYIHYISEYPFPYDKVNDLSEVEAQYAESRHAIIGLKRSGINIHLHFYAIHVR